MKYIRNFLAITVLLLFAVSCDDFSLDLQVDNYEHPDDATLNSDAVALYSKAGGILNAWYMAVHSYNGPGAAMQTMADCSTCSWGNYAMKDLSSEPRVAFNNYSSYTYAYITNTYFNALYTVLTDANTLVAAYNAGTEFENTELVHLMGKLGQAFSVGYLALVFDRVWLSDENGAIGDGSSVDYATAMEWALEKLDEAIAIQEENKLTVPETWLPGGSGESTVFLQFINSMGARMLVDNVRNSTQKASIDWSKVLDYTNNGLQSDFSILMDDVTWYNLIPATYLVYPGWGRVDMRVVNLMDPNTPSYWPTGVTYLDPSTSDDARLETDYEYLSSQSFNASRGSYHYSTYRYSRLDDYITEWTTSLVEFSKSENDMFKAEALLNNGDVSGAAAVVNASTRITRGHLSAVGADADAVYDAIHYERMVEFAYTGMGLSFFEMRKENLLQGGTLLHFPVPGKALESIPEDNYTYGGTQGVAGEDYSSGGWR